GFMPAAEIREQLVTLACRAIGSLTGRLASREDTIPPPTPRIVLVRRCCLGDVLETTPLLSALRRRYPDARIDYATGSYSRPALTGNPDVSAIVSAEVRQLRAGRYDVALTLERSPTAGMLAWRAGIPIRVGPNSQSRGFAHNVRVACPPGRSEAELYLECARALDVPIEGARAKFCPGPGERHKALELLEASGITEPPVGLAPGGAVNPGMTLLAKRWPAGRYAELADRLADETGAPIILVGAASDGDVCAEVADIARCRAVSLAGKTSFGELGAVIARCRLLAGNDSAPLHLSAAVGTPFVGIFGPSDPVRHRPFGEGEVVAAPLPPSTYRNGFAAIDCIDMVAVEEVLAACRRQLATWGQGLGPPPFP
ncbi:MAG: glycosyltransferase family 9 protein, partial [Chloroflexota bacterium]|nr:glycosyltransferase family 9 protein [Chloroflexota bacterium]